MCCSTRREMLVGRWIVSVRRGARRRFFSCCATLGRGKRGRHRQEAARRPAGARCARGRRIGASLAAAGTARATRRAARGCRRGRRSAAGRVAQARDARKVARPSSQGPATRAPEEEARPSPGAVGAAPGQEAARHRAGTVRPAAQEEVAPQAEEQTRQRAPAKGAGRITSGLPGRFRPIRSPPLTHSPPADSMYDKPGRAPTAGRQVPPSSSGLGYQVLILATRVRVPLGV